MTRKLKDQMATAALLVAFVCASVSLTSAGELGKTRDGGKAAGISSGAMAGDQVLAVVNGKKITAGEFEKEVANLPDHLKEIAQTPEGRKEVLDTMITRELILQQAAVERIDKRPEIEERLADLKRRVIVEAYLKEKVERGLAVSEADVMKYYNEHKDRYIAGEELRASQIVVKEEAAAKELLKKINVGTKFEDLAKQYSIGPSAASGGDLGWVKEGDLPKELDGVLFPTVGSGLGEGEVSEVIHASAGYCIVKVTGRRKAVRQFEEVREQIIAELKATRQNETFQGLKADLRAKAKIVINEDLIR